MEDYNMSKIKNFMFDEAEKALDVCLEKLKTDTVDNVLTYAKTLNVDWSFAGFTPDYENHQDCWDEFEDFLWANK
tara:strand:+ start:53827 stop:54051 length:225 start_codon:yes stop_codon:yes gene_type:complete